jgi:small basic protein (TIGR04137 family)
VSIHKSLVSKVKLQRSRNVWTRLERIEALKKEGKFQEGQSVYGLPKVRTSFKIGKRKS